MKFNKVNTSGSSRDEGSTLLACMVVSAVICMGLAGYMAYVGSHTHTMHRSQDWNAAVPIVESGVEEAMAHMNHQIFGTFASNVMSRWEGEGWEIRNEELWSPTRMMDGSSYQVRVSTNRGGSFAPEIVSVGRALTFGYDSDANGKRTVTTNFVSRQIRVRTCRVDIHNFGLLAIGDVVLNGQCSVDSFNSMTTNSWYGLYDERYRSAEGTIGSIAGNIDLGSLGVLYGTNYTSATGTTNNGTVGDLQWLADADNEGFHQSGHYVNDLNTELEPVPEPTGSSRGWPVGGTNSYTESASGTNMTVVNSPTYPVPPPPDGNVTTNTTGGLVTTSELPAGIDPSLVNEIHTFVTNVTFPTNIAASIITTNGPTWYTNYSLNLNSPPVYPLPPATNISMIVAWVTNAMVIPGPAAGTYVPGSVSRSNNPIPQTSPKKYEYTYQRIMGYRYQILQSYTWPVTNYTYTTVTYTYNAPLTNSITIERNFAYILESTPNGYYEMSYLSMGGSDQMLVTGDAVLWVTGRIRMTGQSQIIIRPGASLTIYAGGDVDLGGQGIVNQNNNALDLSIYGLEGCTSVSLSGNARFVGTIYAPFADFAANGSGNSSFDIVGAITANEITMNGNFHVHYDSNLRDAGRVAGYMVRGWYEEKVGTP